MRVLSAAARAAGITGDVVLRRLGTAHHRPCAAQPLRVVRVATDKHHPDGRRVEMVLVTNRVDLEADLIALAYRYRWTVEVCQSQPVKMSWGPLRLLATTIIYLRGRVKREDIGD